MKNYYDNWHKGTSSISVFKGKCSICGDTINLQAHHLSYQPEIFVILCRDCHEEIHNHQTGFVQKNTKYGYEDFRAEHKEVEDITKYVEAFFTTEKQILQYFFIKNKILVKILYGFGTIKEKKEVLEEEWRMIVFSVNFLVRELIKEYPPSFASLVEKLIQIENKNGIVREVYET